MDERRQQRWGVDPTTRQIVGENRAPTQPQPARTYVPDPQSLSIEEILELDMTKDAWGQFLAAEQASAQPREEVLRFASEMAHVTYEPINQRRLSAQVEPVFLPDGLDTMNVSQILDLELSPEQWAKVYHEEQGREKPRKTVLEYSYTMSLAKG